MAAVGMVAWRFVPTRWLAAELVACKEVSTMLEVDGTMAAGVSALAAVIRTREAVMVLMSLLVW